MNFRFPALAALALVCAATTTSSDADACGGCFVSPTENTVVSGHRMALSITTDKTVLWDAIEYAGNPADFSWVLPVKEGAVVDVADPAFFQALEAGTVSQVTAPPENCAPPERSGCSMDESLASADSAGSTGSGGANGVQILNEGTVGPYDTVTLRSTDPNALNAWLEDNGYSVPDDVQPIIDAYVDEKFDFIALKLSPGQGVRSMTPVRVTTEGAGFELPLRMVAAGAGAKVDLVLYVLGEGRYEAANFGNAEIMPELVTWDFLTDTSNYSKMRLAALGMDEAKTWLTSYAQRDGVVGFNGRQINSSSDPSNPNSVQSFFATGMAEAYFQQGLINDGHHSPASFARDCAQRMRDHLDFRVEVGSQEAPLDDFTCEHLDDFAVALDGMHLDDLWITRLEASLPKAALSEDLKLQASAGQDRVQSAFTAGLKVNACWDQGGGFSQGAVPWWSSQNNNTLPPGTMLMLMMGAAGFYLVARRRREEEIAI